MQRRIWVLISSVLVTSFCAFGDTVTDTFWQIAGTGGSYSYGGGTDPLVGTGIKVDAVVDAVNSDPAGFVEYDVLGNASGNADLEFTTGAGTAGTWSWAGGGTLSVTGCIEDPNNLGHCIAGETLNTVLVTDDFTSMTLTPTASGGAVGNFDGGLQGTIDPVAAAFLGVPMSFVSPASQFGTKVKNLPPVAGDAFNTITNVRPGGNLDLYYAVPEGWSLSSTLGIFGFALAAFGVGRRLGLIRAI